MELREAGGLLGEAAGGGERRKITIIDAGWGSSGYYAREVLRRDGPRVFPVGTQMFLDHPTRTEETDRPERSVRDLAARISSTPRMEGGALVAEAQIFSMWRSVIDEIAEDIGVSIRASGQSEFGEAEGRKGQIITSLDEGISVDFVTRAGRGGKVGALVESARREAEVYNKSWLRDLGIYGAEIREARNAGHWLESKIHRDFTEVADNLFGQGYLTRDERIALSSAIGEALTAFNTSVAENVPHLYDRDPYADPQSSAPVSETRRSSGDNQEDHVSDTARLSELEESVRQLTKDREDDKARITALESERDDEKRKRERAEDALLESKADNIIRDAFAATGDDALPALPERGAQRATEAAKAGKLPLTEDGKLDKARLLERLKAAVKEEAEYLAEARPSGDVTGSGGRSLFESLGGASPRSGGSDDQGFKDLVESFKNRGYSQEQAEKLARGRGA